MSFVSVTDIAVWGALALALMLILTAIKMVPQGFSWTVERPAYNYPIHRLYWSEGQYDGAGAGCATTGDHPNHPSQAPLLND